MTGLRDAWVVEYQNQAVEFGEEKPAAEFQENLDKQGIASQLYHEHHVLMKIPYRWLPGENKVEE